MRSVATLSLGVLCLVACGPSKGDDGSDAEDGSDTSATDGTGTGTGTGGDGDGEPCGEDICTADEYCDFEGDDCEAAPFDETQCRPRPSACESPDNPDFTVCGCDGQVYESICEANAVGVDPAADLCEAPQGMFPCGWKMCELDSEICEWTSTDFGTTWFCRPLPDPCTNDYTCDCIKGYYDDQLLCGYTNCNDSDGVKLLCGQP